MFFKRLNGKCQVVVLLIFLLVLTCSCKEETLTTDGKGRYATESIHYSDSIRQKIKFDFDWKFFKGDVQGSERAEFDDSKWRNVDLPHDWSIEGPFSDKWASGNGFLPAGIGWYRKSFYLPAEYKGKKMTILFDGVYMNSDVWINGRHLCKYPNGYCSFYYDFTDKLNFGEKVNTIAVRVDHTDFADSRWYTGSGIYRHVWLIATEKVHVPVWGTFITTPQVTKKSAKININTQVVNDTDLPRTIKLVTEIKAPGNRTVGTTSSMQKLSAKQHYEFVQSCKVADPKLWSPDNPYLYKAVTYVKKDGTISDRLETSFGVRTFRFDANEGFFLNGRNMKMKGLCLHHDAGCLGTAVPDRALERRLQICKQLGANAIRTSHNPPSPELLDLCDEMGFLVIDEAFDEWELGKNKWVKGRNIGKPALDGYNEYFEEWGVHDLKSMIKRDRNHPCVILWSIGNEIDYPNDPYSHPTDKNYDPERPSADQMLGIAKKLIKVVKETDPTRPVTQALANVDASNDTGLADLLDVVGYNYHEKDYQRDHEKYPDRIIMGSENGDYYDAWLAVKNNPFISSQFLWTGVDYLGESGAWPSRTLNFGIVDFTGNLKSMGHWRQSLWAKEPILHIVSQLQKKNDQRRRGGFFRAVSHWTWSGNEGQEAVVTCFSNCDSVELFLNDRSLGTKILKEASHLDYKWTVPYQAGVLKAVGKKDGAVVCTDILRTAGKAAKIVLLADRKTITAHGQDLSHVMVHVVDEYGTVVPDADNLITFSISGPGKIAGVDNGDIKSVESCKSNKRSAYEGKCLAIIQSQRSPGEIILTASSPWLRSAKIKIISN